MTKDVADIIEPPKWKEQGCIPARHFVSLMAFFGMFFNYMLRININFVITAMVKTSNNTNNSDINDPCNYGNGNPSSQAYNGDLEWDDFTQSLVIGSFYWGYVWTPILGGRLAEVIGNRKVFGGAIFGSAILTLLIPWAANTSPAAVITIRFLMGICQGPSLPSTHVLLAIWAPPLERTFMLTFIYAGAQAGTIASYPLAVIIIDGLGWAPVFYIQAGLALSWALLWFFFVTDQPDDFRWITDVEKTYINKSIGENKEKKSFPVPWKSILTSIPFWAIVITAFGDLWGFITLITYLPLFMENMLHTDINANALLSAMPYLGMWIFSLIVSQLGDKVLQKRILTTGAVRKIANTISQLGSAICLFSISLVKCNRPGTIGLLFTAVTLEGAIYTGYVANLLDIAPNFAGTMYGISNTVCAIPAWIAPLTVGWLTDNRQTFGQWEKVFYIAGGMYMAGGLFFLFFSSGEVQKWNKIKEERKFSIKINESFSIDDNYIKLDSNKLM